jgi:hypothetical protein
MAPSYRLSHSRSWWSKSLSGRIRRQEKLIKLDVPKFLIDKEQELIENALDNILIWNLFEISTWEIEIASGEMTVHETSEEGQMLMAMLSCTDDTEEEDLSLL